MVTFLKETFVAWSPEIGRTTALGEMDGVPSGPITSGVPAAVMRTRASAVTGRTRAATTTPVRATHLGVGRRTFVNVGRRGSGCVAAGAAGPRRSPARLPRFSFGGFEAFGAFCARSRLRRPDFLPSASGIWSQRRESS